MLLKNLEATLKELYQPSQFKDGVTNGLIVEGKGQVKTGATAVSLNLDVVQRAVKKKADFLVVHHAHGFWNNQTRDIKGPFKNMLQLILGSGISVFAYHLPMDAHMELGNNICLLKTLGLEYTQGFLPCESQYIGKVGAFAKPVKLKAFIKAVEQKVGKINFSLPFGQDTIKKVAVCSGGAAGSTAEALNTGAQVFLTGEAKEDLYSFCQDQKFNFIAAGHHNTERFGPLALAKYLTGLKQLSKVSFIDQPNPI